MPVMDQRSGKFPLKRKRHLDDEQIENILDLVLTPPKRLKTKSEYRPPPMKENENVNVKKVPSCVTGKLAWKSHQSRRNKLNVLRNSRKQAKDSKLKVSQVTSVKTNRTVNKKTRQALAYKPVSVQSCNKTLVTKSPPEQTKSANSLQAIASPKTPKSAAKSLSTVFAELPEDEKDLLWESASPNSSYTRRFFKTKTPGENCRTRSPAVTSKTWTRLLMPTTPKTASVSPAPSADPMMRKLEAELMGEVSVNGWSDDDSMIANPPTPQPLRSGIVTPTKSQPSSHTSSPNAVANASPAFSSRQSTRTSPRKSLLIGSPMRATAKKAELNTLHDATKTGPRGSQKAPFVGSDALEVSPRRSPRKSLDKNSPGKVASTRPMLDSRSVNSTLLKGDNSEPRELETTKNCVSLSQSKLPFAVQDKSTASPRRSPRKSINRPAIVEKQTPTKENGVISSGYNSSPASGVAGSADLYSQDGDSNGDGDSPAIGNTTDDDSDSSASVGKPLRHSSRKQAAESYAKMQKFYHIFNKPSPHYMAQSKLFGTSPKKSPKTRGQSSPKLRPADDKEQMIIDAGQKQLGASQCDGCGMLFTGADPVDDATHTKFHKNVLTTIKFTGWKSEKVVRDYIADEARVLLVVPESPAYAIKKVMDVNQIMAQELGFSESFLSTKSDYKVFVYVCDKKMVGCCVAEPVSQGYRVISTTDRASQRGDRAWICDTAPHPAAVGVGRIWVYCRNRRQGIATKLLDCVRQNFAYGSVIDKTSVAFSDPTCDGMQLATNYTGTRNFLVYKYN